MIILSMVVPRIHLQWALGRKNGKQTFQTLPPLQVWVISGQIFHGPSGNQQLLKTLKRFFFFKIGTLSTIIFFEEKIALKNPIIQIQNVVKQAKGNVTPECYQLILFFIACLTMEKLLPRVGQSFIYSSAIQDHSLKQRGSQTSGNTIESFIFLSIYTF